MCNLIVIKKRKIVLLSNHVLYVRTERLCDCEEFDGWLIRERKGFYFNDRGILFTEKLVIVITGFTFAVCQFFSKSTWPYLTQISLINMWTFDSQLRY